MSQIIPVILCGGSGERLWPLSTEAFPKQFQKFIGNNTLFQDTIKRVSSINKNPMIITNTNHKFIVNNQLKEAGISSSKILVEPEGKNTAPAILSAAILISKINPLNLLLITPSDHYIPNHKYFCDLAINQSKKILPGQIACFGIKPTRPETNYGYLKINNTKNDIINVEAFIEKPNLENAQKIFSNNNYLWNSGIFMARAEDLINIFKKTEPNLYDLVLRSLKNHVCKENYIYIDENTWRKIEPKSFDFAIMEKVQQIVCSSFGEQWSDLGNFDQIFEIHKRDEEKNLLVGHSIQKNCRDTVIWSSNENHLIVGVGLENISVISSNDATIIKNLKNTSDTREIVNHLKNKNSIETTSFNVEFRPWGWFKTISKNEYAHVKILHVHPKGILSLQSHKYRSENWVVVKGTATVTVNEKKFILEEKQSVFIKQGDIHRLQNNSSNDLEIIEVQTGTYFGEDDIVRYDDLYGRL